METPICLPGPVWAALRLVLPTGMTRLISAVARWLTPPELMQRRRADLIDQRRTAIHLQIDILERVREDLRQDLLDDISDYTKWDPGDLRAMGSRIRRVLDTKYRLLDATRRAILSLMVDTHAVPIVEHMRRVAGETHAASAVAVDDDVGAVFLSERISGDLEKLAGETDSSTAIAQMVSDILQPPPEASRNVPSDGGEDLADFMRTLREELAPAKAGGEQPAAPMPPTMRVRPSDSEVARARSRQRLPAAAM